MASSSLSIALYSVTSFALTALVCLYAYATRIRFYPVLVFLFTSKFALVSLVNSAFVLGVLFSLACVRMFFGYLREAETDALWDTMRFTVMEGAFALATFREELNIRVGVMFSIMVFAKLFQSLLAGRVEHIEQQANPNMRKSVHVRLCALIVYLFVVNAIALMVSVWQVKQYGPSVYFLFAFEHELLVLHLLSLVAKYAICMYDLNVVDGRWANKSAIEMYIALSLESLQVVSCFLYTAQVWRHYGMPIHVMRTLYFSIKTLLDRVMHFIRYRRILHTLHERFPTATEEELANTDGVCIICREEMSLQEAENNGLGLPKKLTCNHLFHAYCLQTWLERQFSCPTCRRPIPTGVPPNGAAAAAAAEAPQREEAPPAAAQAPAAPDSPHHQHRPQTAQEDEEEIYVDRMFQDMEEEFKMPPPQQPQQQQRRREFEPTSADVSSSFKPAAASMFSSSPAPSMLQHEQRRELLELELKVFEAQSRVAKQVYELSNALMQQQQ